MEVELSERAQRILQKLQPASDLAGSIEAVTLDALRMRLRDVVGQLGAFEARYGRTFEQFAGDWNAGRLADRFSHSTERTFMEWEALTMERQELLDLIRELAQLPQFDGTGTTVRTDHRAEAIEAALPIAVVAEDDATVDPPHDHVL